MGTLKEGKEEIVWKVKSLRVSMVLYRSCFVLALSSTSSVFFNLFDIFLYHLSATAFKADCHLKRQAEYHIYSTKARKRKVKEKQVDTDTNSWITYVTVP